ncbi:MAG: M48 family metallopeptidase [Blastomonas sp.]
MMRIITILALLVLTAATGQGGAPLSGYEALRAKDSRVLAIGYRLAKGNVAYCPDLENAAGWALHSLSQYGDRNGARAAFGFEGEFAVLAVLPDGPADRAGIRQDDTLVAINGDTLDLDHAAMEANGESRGYAPLAWLQARMEAALAKGPASITIMRDGQRLEFTVEPELICQSRFEVRTSNNQDASANGRIISIGDELVDFAASESELSALLAHELAHNMLHHRERLNAAGVSRGLLQQFGRSARLIKQTEVEADRLSVWLMANAGYDPQDAVTFWTRYGKTYGLGIFSPSTHYRWKKRVKFISEELEILSGSERSSKGYAPPLLTAPLPTLQ